jgi:hypothetical protein
VNVCYQFLLYHKKFSNSPFFKTYITISHHFDDTLHTGVKTYVSVALQYIEAGLSKLGTENISLLLILTDV